LPDRSAVELKREAVGRINCALVGPLDPNMAGIIDPSSRWYARFVYEVEVPAVLRDVGKTAWRGQTLRYTLPWAAQIDALRRCAEGRKSRQQCNRSKHGTYYIHNLPPSQRPTAAQ